jgi:hypothetical protein
MKNKTSSSAPSKSPRSMPAGPARAVRNNQAKFDRSASLGDDGPSRKSMAPKSSPRPMPAGPARAVRSGQAMLDRSARLGDSGPMNAGTAFRISGSKMGGKKQGYMDGGMVKGGGKACKTY